MSFPSELWTDHLGPLFARGLGRWGPHDAVFGWSFWEPGGLAWFIGDELIWGGYLFLIYCDVACHICIY